MAPVCTDRLSDVAARGTRGDRACVDWPALPMAGVGSKRQVQSQLQSPGRLALAPRDATPDIPESCRQRGLTSRNTGSLAVPALRRAALAGDHGQVRLLQTRFVPDRESAAQATGGLHRLREKTSATRASTSPGISRAHPTPAAPKFEQGGKLLPLRYLPRNHTPANAHRVAA